ncbi:unnamed protein product [Linum trigynum]|uniref:Reverse transcriptase zinc-binding domain-containing protein n=1 Tax=Linum trigynum TaxID=586398 RepID=A0AAV2ED08_9ROSI
MGFRRFEQFNQALLAKIGWRILNEPQSLLAQIYKGKYFSQGSFLSAQPRSRPSWGWQSILFGRQLLSKGLRWQIGNGQKAPLLNSNWIPTHLPSSPVYNPRILPDDGDLTVSAVLYPGEGRWCEDKLSQWFDPLTCQVIRAMPLPRQDIEDRLIWHVTEDGIFTVKSAYHLAVSLDRQSGRWRAQVSWMDKQSWIRVWDANIPPKLKVFVWQILSRILPTTEALIEKDVEVLPRCPVCWASRETMEHLFLDCPVARALWSQAGLESLGEGLPRHTFPLFLKKLLAIVHQPSQFLAVIAILWRIWRSRNWVVFEGKQFSIPVLLRQYNQQVGEWLDLPRDPQSPSALLPDRPIGLASESGGPVCRWDGAVRRGSHSAGGMVLLNEAGTPLWAAGIQFPDLDEPMVVELLTLREAVCWCLAHRFPVMRFEGDAKVIIDKICRADVCDSRVGTILEELVRIFRVNPGFSLRFVGRGGNRVAHTVARKALSLFPTTCRYFDFQTWLASRM